MLFRSYGDNVFLFALQEMRALKALLPLGNHHRRFVPHGAGAVRRTLWMTSLLKKSYAGDDNRSEMVTLMTWESGCQL